MENLWVQYGYDDEINAPVIQTASTEEEAREENELVVSGAPWYRYDVDGGQLINANGPHYFLT
jgi:hypothetical protein